MDYALNEVTDEVIDRLVADINHDGYGCLPGYIPSSALAKMKSFVFSAIDRSAGEYVGFSGATAVVGSTLDDMSASPEFQHLMTRVYESGTGRKAPPVQFYQVLRCLSGRTAKKHSLRFHYDSYVVTALIPVEIPTSGQTGDLVMLPNTRKIRDSYTSNLLDKLLLDNMLSQFLLRVLTSLKVLPLTRIKLVPGNIYFFWGYRSIHTNEPCDPDKVRATALFHFVNPHADSRLKDKLRGQAA